MTNTQVLNVNYFYDFLQFVQYVGKNSITRTATGNISLKEMSELSKVFRNGEDLVFLNREMGWKVKSETECFYLHQIRATTEAMYLIYKRKNLFLLSKNGKAYLSNLEPIDQYQQMILWFWNRVSWEYFNPGPVASILQKNQRAIWRSLLRKGGEWIDFKAFCLGIKSALNMDHLYPQRQDPDFKLNLDIRYALLERNLLYFGCVETIKEGGEENWQNNVTRFRSTDLGLEMYQKGIEPF